MGPLLKFDVDQLIAAEWQDDEFDRYMRNEVEKENTASNHNQPKSNFNTLYQQHLENLNHKSKNRGKVRLSQKAKEQLLENWSHQRHKFWFYLSTYNPLTYYHPIYNNHNLFEP